MKSFSYTRPDTVAEAVQALGAGADVLAGGTTMVDLMKLGVHEPDALVDITGIQALEGHDVGARMLRFGALARMSRSATTPRCRTRARRWRSALLKAACPQLRKRRAAGRQHPAAHPLPLFRDTAYSQCNKRNPGSGCAALDGGGTGLHAVLGGSDACVAMYPGDWAQALIAFDAAVVCAGPGGQRTVASRISTSRLATRPMSRRCCAQMKSSRKSLCRSPRRCGDRRT